MLKSLAFVHLMQKNHLTLGKDWKAKATEAAEDEMVR